MKSKIIVLTASLALLTPLIAFAQTTTDIGSLYTLAIGIINTIIVPTIFAVAFVMFLFGVYRYFIAGGGSEEKVQEGQKFVMWSVVGFALMLSLWGLVNLLINTFGFGGASMPGLPTFNGGTPSTITGSSLGNLFGTGSTNTGSTVTGTTVNPAGSTLVNGVAMPNTMSGAGGTCPTGYTLSNGTCYLNAAYTSGVPSSSSNGSGNVTSGGACTNNNQCQGDLACLSGTCQVDPSLDTSGYGLSQGNVVSGGTCKTNDDCAGNLACNSNGVCAADSSLESPGYGTGAGTVSQGGACMSGADCAGNLTCTNGVCAVDSSLDAGNGSQGAACTSDSQCSGSLQCVNSMCEPDNGLVQQGGQCTQDSDCQGSLACISGTCQVDSSLDSGDTTSASYCCDDGSDPSSGTCSDGSSPYSC